MNLFERIKKFSKNESTISSKTKQAFNKNSPSQELVLDVVGTYYCADAFPKIMNKRREYSFKPETLLKNNRANQRIYKYYYTEIPAELVLEPTNKHDTNAVKVVVKGEKIGYIPADMTKEVRNIIGNYHLISVIATLTGGGYKIVYDDASEIISQSGFYADLKIKYHK